MCCHEINPHILIWRGLGAYKPNLLQLLPLCVTDKGLIRLLKLHFSLSYYIWTHSLFPFILFLVFSAVNHLIRGCSVHRGVFLILCSFETSWQTQCTRDCRSYDWWHWHWLFTHWSGQERLEFYDELRKKKMPSTFIRFIVLVYFLIISTRSPHAWSSSCSDVCAHSYICCACLLLNHLIHLTKLPSLTTHSFNAFRT